MFNVLCNATNPPVYDMEIPAEIGSIVQKILRHTLGFQNTSLGFYLCKAIPPNTNKITNTPIISSLTPYQAYANLKAKFSTEL